MPVLKAHDAAVGGVHLAQPKRDFFGYDPARVVILEPQPGDVGPLVVVAVDLQGINAKGAIAICEATSPAGLSLPARHACACSTVWLLRLSASWIGSTGSLTPADDVTVAGSGCFSRASSERWSRR